ncbi:hypothetical protein [Thalassobaculum sp.]|uniref:anti-sigma factor family protein n=1 Tax=Thalassobaculum sp. TaxID=2022740 RepID=UPI0032EE5C7A
MPARFEDWEIGAYVDGDLPEQRRREISAAAETSPDLACRIDEYTQQKAFLAELADLKVEDDMPDEMHAAAVRLGRSIRLRSWLRRAWTLTAGQARVAAMLLVGAVVGWSAQAAFSDAGTNGKPSPAGFIDEATEAHRTLSLAPMFASDVATVDFAKLSEMFSEVIDPVALRAGGLILTKVDIASTDNGPAVQFLFFDAEMRPVSLLLSVNSAIVDAIDLADGETVVTSYNDFAVAVGRRDGVAFAVTAALPERRVGEIARQLVASAGF